MNQTKHLGIDNILIIRGLLNERLLFFYNVKYFSLSRQRQECNAALQLHDGLTIRRSKVCFPQGTVVSNLAPDHYAGPKALDPNNLISCTYLAPKYFPTINVAQLLTLFVCSPDSLKLGFRCKRRL